MRRYAVCLLALVTLAPACRRSSSPGTANLDAANKVAVRQVRLYYESRNLLLAAEPRNVALPESPAAAISLVVRELMKGPAGPGALRLFPADTVVRGVYTLPGGTVLVDLGGTTLSQGWSTGSHQELMAIYSLVQTVTANVPEGRRVRILVNGVPAETLGGHISLAHSLEPMSSLVEPASR